MLKKQRTAERLASWSRLGLDVTRLGAAMKDWRPAPPKDGMRMNAAQLLCYILLGIPRAGIAPLRRAIAKRFEDINVWACQPFQSPANPLHEWALPCVDALGSLRAELRYWAAFALKDLEALGGDAAFALRRLVANDPDESVRLVAAEALIATGNRTADIVPSLAKLYLEHTDERTRDRALEALWHMDHAADTAVTFFTQIWLHDGDQERRSGAFTWLTVGGPGRVAVPLLLGALSHGDISVRCRAARMLGKMGPKATDTLAALAAYTDHQDVGLRAEVRCAIRLIEKG